METGKDFIQKVKLFKRHEIYFKDIKELVNKYNLWYRITLIKKRNMLNKDCIILRYTAFSKCGVAQISISMLSDETQINVTKQLTVEEMLKKLRL